MDPTNFSSCVAAMAFMSSSSLLMFPLNECRLHDKLVARDTDRWLSNAAYVRSDMIRKDLWWRLVKANCSHRAQHRLLEKSKETRAPKMVKNEHPRIYVEAPVFKRVICKQAGPKDRRKQVETVTQDASFNASSNSVAPQLKLKGKNYARKSNVTNNFDIAFVIATQLPRYKGEYSRLIFCKTTWP